MSHWDVFNGDADGICALHQLRLAQPRAAMLVTGIKRDIALLRRVEAVAGDTVTVLDVSLDRNREALLGLLARGVEVEYFDHHFAGEIPVHPNLRLRIDTAAGICTSLLVDRHLAGAHRAWAVVGAFGDDLPTQASAFARGLGLDIATVQSLRELGEGMNYNAYGGSEEDLMLAPARLYERVRPYRNPLDFIKDEPLAKELALRQRADLLCAEAHAERTQLPGGEVHRLPDTPWARRVLGSYANALSQREPTRAHAVLRPDGAGAAVVSVRSPRTAPAGADLLCRAFGGSGRASAAGIDHLPWSRYDAFIEAFARAFPGGLS